MMTTSLVGQALPVCAVVTVLCVGEAPGVGAPTCFGAPECEDAAGCARAEPVAAAEALALDGTVKSAVPGSAEGAAGPAAWPTSAAGRVGPLPPTTPFTAQASSPRIAMPMASAITLRRQKVSGWGARCWPRGAFWPIARV